jgi:LacI family transcriptional regulator
MVVNVDSVERRAVTIRDVAARAEVSVGTVSKALNGRGKLRPETRARVEHAARELGFRPNVMAQGLLAGRTSTIGLVTTDSRGRFRAPIMLGVQDALAASQMSVIVCDTRDDPIRERHHIQTLLARRVDGIIVTGWRIEAREPIESPVPVVYAMTQSTNGSDFSVLPDDEHGAMLAIRHLVATGRRRIGHIAGPDRFLVAHKRAEASLRALEENGLEVAGGSPLHGEWSEDWGRQASDILLRADPDLDAIFCSSDQLARGAMDTLRERGIAIPDRVAVIGFDNWIAMATACRPQLTTIDMSLQDVGRVAGEHLLAAIDGTPLPEGLHQVPCRLIVRGSTG